MLRSCGNSRPPPCLLSHIQQPQCCFLLQVSELETEIDRVRQEMAQERALLQRMLDELKVQFDQALDREQKAIEECRRNLCPSFSGISLFLSISSILRAPEWVVHGKGLSMGCFKVVGGECEDSGGLLQGHGGLQRAQKEL